MTTDRAKRYAANRLSDRAKRLIWRFRGRDGIKWRAAFGKVLH
jgi:hypothetical protein